MGGVLVRARHELRAHALAIVGFILLVGVVGGVVLATAAGARRTATAYDRFLDQSRAEDVLVGGFGPGTPEQATLIEHLEALSVVDSVAPVAVMGLVTATRGEPPVDPVAPVRSGQLFDTIARPNLLAGRRPDPAVATEIMVNPAGADAYDLEVGDVFTMVAVHEADFYANPGRDPSTYGESRDFVVTGIAVLPQHIVPVAPADALTQVFLTPAYVAAHPDEAFSYTYNFVRLADGAADEDAFVAGLTATVRELGLAPAFIPTVFGSDRRAAVDRSIRPQAQALAAFSVLLALVAVAVIGQLVSRHLAADSEDRQRLWALGFTRRELLAVGATRVALIVVSGVIVAVGVAGVLSSRFPIGPARLAEPHRGTSLNLAIIGLGSVVLLAGLVTIPVVALRRSLPGVGRAGRAHSTGRVRVRFTSWLATVGAPSSAVIGVQTAVERGQGSRALPTGGALASAVVAVAALTAALTFGANLDRLVTTPALYGWDWDLAVGTGFTGLPPSAARSIFDRPDVVGYSGINFGRLDLIADDGSSIAVPAVGLDELDGSVFPRLSDGRRAASDDEVVLGARTAEQLGVSTGDQLELSPYGYDEHRSVTVVGLAVFPGLGAGIFATTDLGVGAQVPASVLEDEAAGGRYTAYLVDLSDDADVDAVAVDFAEAFATVDANCIQPGCVVGDLKPPGIKNYDGLRRTPLLLASVLAALVVITLAVNLAGAVRRRRRDTAALRSLGFVRRQVGAVWSWHATAVAIVAVVFGVPVGLVVGRELWSLFADAAGAYVPAETPVVVLLVVPGTLLAANLLALVPGRVATRTSPGRALSAE